MEGEDGDLTSNSQINQNFPRDTLAIAQEDPLQNDASLENRNPIQSINPSLLDPNPNKNQNQNQERPPVLRRRNAFRRRQRRLLDEQSQIDGRHVTVMLSEELLELLQTENMDIESIHIVLELQERENIETGLSEETINERMRQRTFSALSENNTGPCCICLEEYVENDQVGRLHCGHDFHSDCIKTWLVEKNKCPICKRWV